MHFSAMLTSRRDVLVLIALAYRASRFASIRAINVYIKCMKLSTILHTTQIAILRWHAGTLSRHVSQFNALVSDPFAIMLA